MPSRHPEFALLATAPFAAPRSRESSRDPNRSANACPSRARNRTSVDVSTTPLRQRRPAERKRDSPASFTPQPSMTDRYLLFVRLRTASCFFVPELARITRPPTRPLAVAPGEIAGGGRRDQVRGDWRTGKGPARATLAELGAPRFSPCPKSARAGPTSWPTADFPPSAAYRPGPDRACVQKFGWEPVGRRLRPSPLKRRWPGTELRALHVDTASFCDGAISLRPPTRPSSHRLTAPSELPADPTRI